MSNIELLLKKAQETNSKESYAEIGDIYFYGKDIPKDMSQAVVYYKKAADLGSVYGMERIGLMHYKGYGVAQNNKLAKRYLQTAANQGSIQALVDLGWMCYNGDYGFFASKGKAFELWLKASKRGNTEAQIYVATSYLGDDWDEEKSYRKAAFWFMCAYQNRKATNNQIGEAKAKLDMLARYVNLNDVKDEIVRKYSEYLNL